MARPGYDWSRVALPVDTDPSQIDRMTDCLTDHADAERVLARLTRSADVRVRKLAELTARKRARRMAR